MREFHPKNHPIKFKKNGRGIVLPRGYVLSMTDSYHIDRRIEEMAKNGHRAARKYIRQECGRRHLQWVVGHA